MHHEDEIIEVDRSSGSVSGLFTPVAAKLSGLRSRRSTEEQPSHDTNTTQPCRMTPSHKDQTTTTVCVTDFGQSRKVERNPSGDPVKIKLKAGHGTYAFTVPDAYCFEIVLRYVCLFVQALELRPDGPTPSGSDRLSSSVYDRHTMVEVDPFAVDVWAFGFLLYEW